MAKSPLLLLAAMIATDTITYDQGKQWVEFCDESDANHTVPATLDAAVGMALDYFHDDPDTEAAKVAERVRSGPAVAEHDEATCPDCGADTMDSADYEQAINLWAAVRAVCDKYAFDQEYAENGPDVEEC